MSRLPLHALPGFIAAARHGNLSRAAESLHLTVSALSHQMRALEERLGRQLLHRSQRGVSLTAEGQTLLDRIAPHMDALAQALQPFSARRENVLGVSVTPTMASAWLVPRLGDFLAAYPQIEINLRSSANLVDFARDTDIDAALRIGRGLWPGVHAEHLFDEWLAPVASPGLVERMGPPGTRPLEAWPLLGDPDPDNQWRHWFQRHGGREPARYVATFDDSETLHRAAVEGVGVALGRLTRLRLLLDSGQLVTLSQERLKANYAHYLVYPPRSSEHAGVLAFRDWLRTQVGKQAGDAGRGPSDAPAEGGVQ
ncbi:LysR substrate-binding domain-containing protein [Luteimonas vadosa]|uniref:LysR substrate-binding domain-containing protein n=1 Tax=Luteimonas vadosa TaxID=1165507 RepID=A0ABP9DTH4_9GAMM